MLLYDEYWHLSENKVIHFQASLQVPHAGGGGYVHRYTHMLVFYNRFGGVSGFTLAAPPPFLLPWQKGRFKTKACGFKEASEIRNEAHV